LKYIENPQKQRGRGKVRKSTSQLADLATLSLIVWYPLEHLYAYHSAIGNIPRFMDGVFGLLELVLSGIFGTALLILLCRRRHFPLPIVLISMFTGFIVITASWIVFHYLFLEGPRGGMLPFEYYSRILISYLFLFLVGLYARPEKWSALWIVLFVLITVNSIVFMDWNRLMIDLRNVIDPSYNGMYLSLSTTAMFAGFFAWSAAKKPSTRTICLCLLGVVLFIMGSRANFVGFLIVMPVALSFTLHRTSQIAFYCIVVFMGVTALFLIDGWEMLSVSRHAQLFSPSEMTSLIARNEVLQTGMDGVLQNPIFGHYAGQLEGRGTIGSYIHNWLSVWQAFGIIPFLLFTLLMISGVVFAFRTFWLFGRRATHLDQLLSVLLLLVTVLVLAAKSVGWSHISLVWGMLTARFFYPGLSGRFYCTQR